MPTINFKETDKLKYFKNYLTVVGDLFPQPLSEKEKSTLSAIMSIVNSNRNLVYVDNNKKGVPEFKYKSQLETILSSKEIRDKIVKIAGLKDNGSLNNLLYSLRKKDLIVSSTNLGRNPLFHITYIDLSKPMELTFKFMLDESRVNVQ